ncbi:MAG: hypothetical protein VKK04_24955 [Synechococcales bacterium]|nr:hypothetical protein [Synechococcales bacterium]
MDKQALTNGLATMIEEERPNEIKIFLRLLKEVWEIDWTVAAYDVMSHFLEFDIPYFYRFMALDQGDEASEQQLIMDWVSARMALRNMDREKMIAAIDEVNQLRTRVRTA